MKIYDIKVKDGEKEILMSEYRNKVLLIVNTATECGFTPQYEGLEKIYKKYKEKGFEILDFPSNQFLNQAPGSDEEIVSFCKLNYGTTFKTFSKVDVNGDKAAPIFKYLKKNELKEEENQDAGTLKKILKGLSETIKGNSIKWNFTKFLVDRNGDVIGRFPPTFKPEELEEYIEKALEGGEKHGWK